MSCLECTDCPDIGTFDICNPADYVIGYTTPNTSVVVAITDVSLNQTFFETQMTNAQGLVAISPTFAGLPLQKLFAPNRTYEVRVYLDYIGGTAANLDGDELPLTLPPTYTNAESCFSFQFKYINL